jgi:hypothetical protein
MGYFISSVIGPRNPPLALHAMYYTRTVFLSTDTLISGTVTNVGMYVQYICCPFPIQHSPLAYLDYILPH